MYFSHLKGAVVGLKFRKIHGAGNDFVLITGSHADLHKDWSDMARQVCARRTGVGADGLVLSAWTSAEPGVLDVVCVNADGSIASMCGNALRCVAWSVAQDHALQEMTLVMAGVDHQAVVTDEAVWVTAEAGAVSLGHVEVVWNGRLVRFDSAYTGTEHVVAVVDDVDGIDAEGCGLLVRHHVRLAPLGSNVNFVQVTGTRELRIRTYEREGTGVLT